MTCISRISIRMMKNGSCMTMVNAKGFGWTRMKLDSLPQRWSFMEDKLCIWWDHRGIIHFELLNCRLMFLIVAMGQQEKRCASLYNIKSHSRRNTQVNIRFKLACSLPSIIFSRLCTNWVQSFSFEGKSPKWKKIFWKIM